MGRFAAEHFLPGEGRHIELVPRQVLGKGGRGRIANREASTVRRDRIARGHAYTCRCAVPRKDNIGVIIQRCHIDDLAVFGCLDGCVELELLDHIGDPARAEAFPSHHSDRARAKQAPHRHFHSARVGCRNNTDMVIHRDAEQLTRFFDGSFQLVFANSGTVGAAQRCAFKLFQIE